LALLIDAFAARTGWVGIVPSCFRPTHRLRGDARTEKGNADALAALD